MATRAKRPTGRIIEVKRVVSVGRDRDVKGGAVVRLRDERGAMLALRLRPGQVRTLVTGWAGLWRRWTDRTAVRTRTSQNPGMLEG